MMFLSYVLTGLLTAAAVSVLFIVFGKNNKNKIEKARTYLVNNYNEISSKAKNELDELLK